MRPIQDQYSDLVAQGKMTRQRAYQLRHHAQGKCCKCGAKAITKNYCLDHAVYERERQRRVYNTVDQYNSLTVRLQREHTPPQLDQLAAE